MFPILKVRIEKFFPQATKPSSGACVYGPTVERVSNRGFSGAAAGKKDLEKDCTTTGGRLLGLSLDPVSSCSGFLIKTRVAESAVEGLGRYSLEEHVPKGTCIRRVKVVTGSSPDAFKSGRVTSVRNATEAETAFRQLLLDEEEESTVLATRLSDMCWSPDGRTANLFSPSNYVNHQSGSDSNIRALFDSGRKYVEIIATKNIAKGDELFKDYSTFRNPPWLTKYAWAEANQPCTQSLGRMLTPVKNPHSVPVRLGKQQASHEVSYSNLHSLVISYPRIKDSIEQKGFCVLRYDKWLAFNEERLSESLPYFAKAAQMKDTIALNAAGGKVQRNVLKESGITANEVLLVSSPSHEVRPHHELLFTPFKPERLAFILLEGGISGGATSLFDAQVALDFLHSSKNAD